MVNVGDSFFMLTVVGISGKIRSKDDDRTPFSMADKAKR